MPSAMREQDRSMLERKNYVGGRIGKLRKECQEMSVSDRRNFIEILVGGLAASAAVRMWPFRVYSFPSKIELRTHFGPNGFEWNYDSLLICQVDIPDKPAKIGIIQIRQAIPNRLDSGI
jgi:hypothetical protein